jgi:outer membrane protein assembly factor BamB
MPDAGTLDPIWRYEADAGARLTFTGTIDAAGNVYWLECGDALCTLVSSTRDGYLRYQTPLTGLAHANGDPVTQPGVLALAGGVVLYAAPVETLIAFDPETGDFRWALDVHQDLNLFDPPQPCPFPSDVLLTALVAVPDGGASITAYMDLPPDAGCVTFTAPGDRWRLFFDPASGHPQRWFPLDQPLTSAVGDLDGEVYASDGVNLSAFDPDGGQRFFTHLEPPVEMQAEWGGWAYASSVGTWAVSTADGGAHELGRGLELLTSGGVAAGADGGFLLALGAVDGGGPQASLFGLDVTSAQVTWQIPLGADTTAEGPLLTARTTALLMATPGGLNGSGTPYLTEVLPTGQPAYVCALPTGTPALLTPALGPERLIVSEALGDGGVRLEAFAMTGVSPATSGWTGPGGSNNQCQSPAGP